MRKWLYKCYCIIISKCPNCEKAKALYCHGPVSETETCRYCGWTEWEDFKWPKNKRK